MFYGNGFMGFAQQGWQCPVCGRIYSPNTPMCLFCGGQPSLGRIEITCRDSDTGSLLNGGTDVCDCKTTCTCVFDPDDFGCGSYCDHCTEECESDW